MDDLADSVIFTIELESPWPVPSLVAGSCS